jgi:hypothetical protein
MDVVIVTEREIVAIINFHCFQQQHVTLVVLLQLVPIATIYGLSQQFFARCKRVFLVVLVYILYNRIAQV